MKHFQSHHARGFTLVEMLIYVAILLIVSTASILFIISLDRLVTQYRIETALYRSGSGVLEQVLVGIRQADSLDALNSVFENNSAGALALTNGASSTEFVLESGQLNLILDGQEYGSLTSDEVTVTDFTVFRHPTAIGDLVRVRLGLSVTLNGVDKNITLYAGGVIRGSL